MPTANIIYIHGRLPNNHVLERYENYTIDESFAPNKNKTAIYFRRHEVIYRTEFGEGNKAGFLLLLASKLHDTDRAKAKALLENTMKKLKVEGEIKEFKSVTQLTVKELLVIRDNDSLHALSQPIAFRNDETMSLLAQTTIYLLSRLKRLSMVSTPEARNEIKLIVKLLASVAEKP